MKKLLPLVIFCLCFPLNLILGLESRGSALSSAGQKASGAKSSEAGAKTDPIPAELKKFREMMREGKELFFEEDAKSFLEEVLPLVEKITQRKLKVIPPVKLVGRKEIREALYNDLLPQMKKLLSKENQDLVEKTSRQEAEGLAPLLLGKYGFSDRVLYLLPKNVQPLFRVTRIDEKHAVPLTRLIVAHELTHAIQDQEIDLKHRLSNLSSPEEALCISATIEGHAVLVMEQVAREMKLDESLIATSRLFAAGAVKFDDPGLRLINNVISSRFESIYMGGKKFMEFHAGKGVENLWEILKNPPSRTGMILNPETYSVKAAARLDYAGLFEGIEKDLGRPGYRVQNIEVGLMNLQSIYAAMEPSRREATLQKIEHVQAFVASAQKSGKMGTASLFILKKPGEVASMVQDLELMARHNFEELKKSTLVKIEGVDMADFPEAGTEVSRKMTLKLRGPDKVLVKQVIYRIGSGPLLLEIMDGDQDLPERKIIDVMKKIFRRYENLTRESSGEKPE